jgi:hypothetical protein
MEARRAGPKVANGDPGLCFLSRKKGNDTSGPFFCSVMRNPTCIHFCVAHAVRISYSLPEHPADFFKFSLVRCDGLTLNREESS